MQSDHPSKVRAVLHSCPVEIGGAATSPSSVRRHPARLNVIFGFLAIYLIWGSTYLGIRYAVESIPPLIMMGVRHLLAGVVVFSWTRARGTPAPRLRQWGYALIAGALLFLGGHGTLAWAEQKVPSGSAALLCATLPLWTVLLSRVDGSERKLGPKAWAGLLLGFAGVALLIGPDGLRAHLDLLAAGVVISSALLWAIGTSYSRSVKMSSSTVLSAAMQMMSGGATLLVAGVLTGEAGRVHLSTLTLRSVLALAYLVVFGSIIAFTVYTWLVSVSSPSRVSTYAYVNPVVAVLIGWLVAGEAVGVRTFAATAIILGGVALVSTGREQLAAKERGPQSPNLQRVWEPAGD